VKPTLVDHSGREALQAVTLTYVSTAIAVTPTLVNTAILTPTIAKEKHIKP